jgi:hypothetical protein
MIFKRKRTWLIPLVLVLMLAIGCANVSGQIPEQSADNHLNSREELEILKQLWGGGITEAEYIQKIDPEVLRRMSEEEIGHAEATKIDCQLLLNVPALSILARFLKDNC